MSTIQKIADIENEMARTQKNKATAYHVGLLKAKLAKLKREILAPSSKGGKPGEGFDVTKSGDARVGMIGFPSVGKSTLLTKLTGTHSEVAAYEFTTLTCIPGSIQYKGCKIQLLDLPGIIEGAKDGKGRGRQVIGVARTCNLILVVLDAGKPMIHKRIIEKELEGFGIRLNQKPPNIILKKKEKGGLAITKALQLTKLDNKMITAIAKEYKISNADITFRQDCNVDQLIDVIEGNRKYIPCLYVLNKCDTITLEELELLSQVPNYVPVCAGKEWGFDDLLEKMWSYLDMKRIYTKPRGRVPDYDAPVVVPSTKCTIEEFCMRIHRSLLEQFKHALVWGTSVKHGQTHVEMDGAPQKCGRDHELQDEDVVQIVKRIG